MNKTTLKKVRRAFLAALLICIMPLLAHAFNTWQYKSSDSIEKARIDTEYILARFEKTKDANEIRSWLSRGSTEAPGTQVNIAFGRWALQHQNDFINIVEGLQTKQQADFIEFFCNSLNQSSLGAEFKAAFKGRKSKSVAAILKNLA